MGFRDLTTVEHRPDSQRNVPEKAWNLTSLNTHPLPLNNLLKSSLAQVSHFQRNREHLLDIESRRRCWLIAHQALNGVASW